MPHQGLGKGMDPCLNRNGFVWTKIRRLTPPNQSTVCQEASETSCPTDSIAGIHGSPSYWQNYSPVNYLWFLTVVAAQQQL